MLASLNSITCKFNGHWCKARPRQANCSKSSALNSISDTDSTVNNLSLKVVILRTAMALERSSVGCLMASTALEEEEESPVPGESNNDGVWYSRTEAHL